MHFPRALLTALLVAPTTLFAQQWVELMLDEHTPVPEVKAAFDAHWQGRSYVRGQGWKQFQRWHWFMDQRTWPEGQRLNQATHRAALEEAQALRTAKGARDAAIWEPLGPTHWTSISYNPGNGRVNCIVADPNNPDVIYVGTPSSGLWRSTDHGATWTALYTDYATMGVSGIAIDPTNSDLIYVATGDGDGSDTYSTGVIKSTDGGATWSQTGLTWNLSLSRTTRSLRLDPSDPQRLFCATSAGLQRTQNGGETWQQAVSGGFRDVEFKPDDPTVLYACTDRFYRSTDGGMAFLSNTSNGLPATSVVGRMAVAVSPAAPEVVYVLCSNEEDNSFLGLWRSDDAGISFTLRSDAPNIFSYAEDGDDSGGQAWYDMALAVEPGNADAVYVGGINVWKSTDGGASWEIRSHWVFPSEVGYTHADIHSLDFYNGALYCGSDGGIHVSDDNGGSWADRSAGLDIMQFYRLGGSELLPDLIMAGAQDNGSNRYQGGAWTHVFGADGMEAAVDPFDANVVYSSSQNGGLRRSDNGGVDWESLTDMITEEGAWVTPFALSSDMPNRMLSGYENLLLSDDQGQSWVDVTGWPLGTNVRCLAFAPSDGTVWYAARNDQAVRLTEDGWNMIDIRPGLPTLTPTSIAVDHDDPLHVWISFSGQSANSKVYESVNGGLTWVNRSNGLPNTPVNCIAHQPGSPNGLYAGTDLGVFYRDDYTGAWEPYGTGMPFVVVSEVEVNMTLGKLRAATYGRGIWQADLYYSPFAGMEEASAPERPRLVPVDREGRYRLVLAPEHGALKSVRVFDAMGRATGAPWQPDGHIDLSNAASAAYVVQVITDQGRWSMRAVR